MLSNDRILKIHTPAAMALYFSACYVLPEEWWITELMHLGLSAMLPLCLLVCIYILVFRRKIWLRYFISLVLMIKFLLTWFSINWPSDNAQNTNLKVISFNTATLDTKRFSGNINNPELVDYSPMYEFVSRHKDADLLCLQEFYDSFKPDMQTLVDSIVELGSYKYYCINPFFSQEAKGFFGVIMFSKTVPDHCEKLIYGDDAIFNKGLFFDFIKDEDTLRVLSLHLASMSIRLTKNHPLNFIETVSETYKRLQIGFEKRNREMDVIEDFLRDSPTNTIVCGDFNATPHMRANNAMRKNFKDTHLQAGFGNGFTYHHFPNVIKIDYQYYRGNITATSSFVDRSANFSDHYPLVAQYHTSTNFLR